MPTAKPGQFADKAGNSGSADQPGQSANPPSPGLLQMLMLGGKPTYSGTPTSGGSSGNPWAWLSGMWGSPSGGGGR